MADKDIKSVDTQDNIVDEVEDSQELESKTENNDVKDTKKPEKMLSVSRVNQLVKKAKYEGEQKMAEQLEQAQAELQRLREQQQATENPAQQQQAQPSSIGGIQQARPEEIERQIAEAMERKLKEREEAMQKQAVENQMKQVADQFFSKMEQGKQMFDDFEDITASFDPAAFPSLVYLANEVENTPAVIYELQKNPSKLTHLAFLVERSPQMARHEIAKLSQSITANQQAIQQESRQADEPLSRMQPSKVGADNGQPKSVRDYKNADWLKA